MLVSVRKGFAPEFVQTVNNPSHVLGPDMSSVSSLSEMESLPRQDLWDEKLQPGLSISKRSEHLPWHIFFPTC